MENAPAQALSCIQLLRQELDVELFEQTMHLLTSYSLSRIPETEAMDSFLITNSKGDPPKRERLLAMWPQLRSLFAPVLALQQLNPDQKPYWYASVIEQAEAAVRFWFPSLGETNESFWFTRDQSAQQQKIDSDVRERFAETLCQLCDPNLQAMSYLSQHCQALTPNALLGVVLILDQFSRHIHREQPGNFQRMFPVLLPFVRLLLEKRIDDSLTYLKYRLFMLLPLRHAKQRDHLTLVNARIAEYSASLSSIIADEADREAAATLLHRFKENTAADTRKLDAVEEQGFSLTDYHSVLEFPILPSLPVVTAQADAQRKHPLYKTVLQYMRQRSADLRHVVISLSGGVDSMVLAHILCDIGQTRGFAYKVVAIHIDYGNREESALEAQFVERFCELRGIVFHQRRIEEFKRGVTPREEYERESRSIRFQQYRLMLEQYGAPAVVFGHHQGDLQENVFTNVMNGRSILDLCVMQEQREVLGVRIWRPMFTHPKSVVFHYAHQFGIPYFLDTTPKWSNRGKLRNELFPAMAERYGNFQVNLSEIGQSSMDWSRVVNEMILQPLHDSVVRSELGIAVELGPYRTAPMAFWREVLRHLLHSMAQSMCTNRASIEFVNRLQTGTYSGMVVMSKGVLSFLNRTLLVIFHPRFLQRATLAGKGRRERKTALEPVATLEPDAVAKVVVGLKTVPVGEWFAHRDFRILVEPMPPMSEDKTVAKPEPWDFATVISGEMSYRLPNWPPFFIPEKPAGRIREVTSLPMEVRRRLPVVAATHPEGGRAKAFVRVTLRSLFTHPDPVEEALPAAAAEASGSTSTSSSSSLCSTFPMAASANSSSLPASATE